MKKVLILATIFIVALAFSGCTKSNSNIDDANSASIDTQNGIPEPPVPPAPDM